MYLRHDRRWAFLGVCHAGCKRPPTLWLKASSPFVMLIFALSLQQSMCRLRSFMRSVTKSALTGELHREAGCKAITEH